MWYTLHVGTAERLKLLSYTWGISAGLMTAAFFMISALYGSSGLSALFISILNIALPNIMKILTMKVEKHKDEGDIQQSIMLKLVLVRCINSAILLYAVTDYRDTFSQDSLASIQAILIADMFTTPVFRLFNIPDWIKRNFIAPKARTQDAMNNFYRGAIWNLAERYTDMIKTIFVGFFYSTILPSGLFITAFAMLTTYWVDKYSLLRIWRRPPALDESLAVQSRQYIILIVWVHLIMARIFFANWPYERRFEESNCGLLTCDTNKYMTKDQETVVQVYSIAGIIVTIIGIVFVFANVTWRVFTALFKQRTVEVGAATNIAYRDVSGIAAFVPLIHPNELPDPLMAVDVSLIPRAFLFI
jgi:hypothetical protein